MNPYDFVRIDWTRTPNRRRPHPHGSFAPGTLTGRLEGTVTALSPLFLPDNRSGGGATIQKFLRNGNGKAIIPGSSLKGLIRSLVETLAPGCWWLFDGSYDRGAVNFTEKLPKPFERCNNPATLCPACRLFGMLDHGALRLGNVGFEDAVAEVEKRRDPIFTPILDTPKPRHRAWYLDRDQNQVAGRKYYFHQPHIKTARELKKSKDGTPYNSHIHPLDAGSVFRFSAAFENLDADDWSVLLFALTLEPKLRHKLGYAKPIGLGSVEIQLDTITLVDPAARYRSGASCRRLTGDTLVSALADATARFTSGIPADTLADLRHIWSWPANDTIDFDYPTQRWFENNPSVPISQA